jgi:hypothetical protein
MNGRRVMEVSAMSGAVQLGQLVGRLALLDVACRHRDRHGRLSVARLVVAHGAAMPLPALLRVVAGDCPGVVSSASIYQQCGAHFPGLVGLGL